MVTFDGNEMAVSSLADSKKSKVVNQIAQINREYFNKGVKSLTEKLQLEYEKIKKLKDSPALSTEREAEILHARSHSFGADFEEQERANQEIHAYNCKVEGIVMTLEALSASYGIRTFSTKRFLTKYLV